MRRHNSGKAFKRMRAQRYDNHGEEYRQFVDYLRRNTATCTMACVALNIYRPNGTRFKRWAQEAGQLWEVRKGICAVTGFPAQYLTTNPELKPVDPQTSLSDGMEDGA